MYQKWTRSIEAWPRVDLDFMGSDGLIIFAWKDFPFISLHAFYLLHFSRVLFLME